MALGNAIVFIGGDLTGLNKALGNAERSTQRSFGNIAGKMKQMGTAMTGFGLAAGVAIGGAMREAFSFGEGLSKVATLGVNDLEGLGEGLQDLRVQYGLISKGTKELYDTISAGVGEDAALGVLEQAARGAIAGVGDLSTALDAGTSLMNAYGKKGETAAEAIENMREIQGKLFTAIKYGKTTMDDIGGSIGRVGGLAAEAGVPMEELLAVVAGATTTGLDAAESMSGLKSVLSNILKPSEDAADAAAALGIEFDAQALAAKGLVPFLTEMRRKIEEGTAPMAEQAAELSRMIEFNENYAKGLEDQIKAMERVREPGEALKERLRQTKFELRDVRDATSGLKTKLEETGGVTGNVTSTMAMLFGSMEAANVVLGVTGEQAGTVKTALEGMSTATENLNTAVEEGMKNDPTLPMRQAVANLKVTAEDLGKVVIPAFNETLKSIEPIVTNVSAWVKENPKLTASLASAAVLMAPAGLLLTGLASFATMTMSMGTLVGSLAGAIGIGAAPLVGIGVTLMAALWALADLLGAAGIWTADDGNPFHGSISKHLSRIKDLADQVTETHKVIGTLGSEMLDQLTLGFRKAWEQLNNLIGLMKTLPDVWKAIIPGGPAGDLGPFKAALKKGLLDGAGHLTPGFASGVGYAPAGLALVGERGPELVRMRGGERVWSNADSERMIAAMREGGRGTTVNFSGPITVVANDPDEMKRRLLHQARMAGGVL